MECKHGRPECECQNPKNVLGTVHYHSEVRIGPNYEGKNVVELRLTSGNNTNVVVVDRPTAARLINQLRRSLDEDWNQQINERP